MRCANIRRAVFNRTYTLAASLLLVNRVVEYPPRDARLNIRRAVENRTYTLAARSCREPGECTSRE